MLILEKGSDDISDVSPLERKIVDQIEFYFGDYNLNHDKFLHHEQTKDNGWVPLDTLIKFNRLKALTSDFDIIIKALEKSFTELMEISNDRLKIRRSLLRPLPESTADYLQDIKTRTIYAKGFPNALMLDDLKMFFAQYGEPKKIVMHYYYKDVGEQCKEAPRKTFKGSVFVTFATSDEASKFLKAEEVRFKDTQLTRMSHDEYYKLKLELRKQIKADKKAQKDEAKKKQREEKRERLATKFISGLVLNVSGLPTTGVSLKDIKKCFKKYGDVQQVDFARETNEAQIRFGGGEKAAYKVIEKAKADSSKKTKKALLNGSEIELRVLVGEVEKEYWKKVSDALIDARVRKHDVGKKGRGRKIGRGRSCRRGNRSRGRGCRSMSGGSVGSPRRTPPSVESPQQTSPVTESPPRTPSIKDDEEKHRRGLTTGFMDDERDLESAFDDEPVVKKTKLAADY